VGRGIDTLGVVKHEHVDEKAKNISRRRNEDDICKRYGGDEYVVCDDECEKMRRR
jgi:hypothetical protein